MCWALINGAGCQTQMDLNETWRGSDRDIVGINCCFLGVSADRPIPNTVCVCNAGCFGLSKQNVPEGRGITPQHAPKVISWPNIVLAHSEYFPGLGDGVTVTVPHLFWTFEMSKCIAVLK